MKYFLYMSCFLYKIELCKLHMLKSVMLLLFCYIEYFFGVSN